MGRHCFLLSKEVATIDARVAESFSIFQWILQKHGLTPSYGPGKRAVLISYRGKKSAPLHRRRFAQSDPCIPCVVEHGHSVSLCVVLTYKPLGSIVDGDSLLPEIKARGAMAVQAVKPLSKHCFGQCEDCPHLASLGTSVLVHNIGTWRRLNEQEFTAWTSAVWKLYGCMFRGDPLADFHRRSIEHVTLAAGGFLPLALLHVSRLRLFISLLRAPDDLLPFAIEANYKACGEDSDHSWYSCVLRALDWLYATVGAFPSYNHARCLRPSELGFCTP